LAPIGTSKDIVGEDLGDVLELGRALGVTVSDDAEGFLSRVSADLAIIATKSRLRSIRKYPYA
jgi:4-hydroxy-tetrahydrodipicolinate reductase